MPVFQSNQQKNTCILSPSIPDEALYVIWPKICQLIYFFENLNGRCRDERWTIGILKPHMSFQAHIVTQLTVRISVFAQLIAGEGSDSPI